MKISAIVPLGGSVQPAEALTPVDGVPALARVVRALLGPGRVPTSQIVVVAAESLAAAARNCLDSAGLSAVRLIASEAAAARRTCLIAGLDHVGGEPHSPSHILVGDHRYPLAAAEVTDRVIAGLGEGHPMVVPILPVSDTVKAVDHRGAVVSTVDRTALRTVQSPRGYQFSVLAELIADGKDELAVALSSGVTIATVDGDADSFAADLPVDGELLGAITSVRRSS